MKAIILLSGGLDSSLALKLIVDQGIQAISVHFTTSFYRYDGPGAYGAAAKNISEFTNTKLKIIHLKEEYLDIIKSPAHGYGRNMNPCVDCRILKFKVAGRIMKEENASFIVTGEVLGQRPMSQRRDAMNLIERESGLKGLIVRPLSAKMLPPSIPEENGWVNRDKFLNFTGRNRKPQIKLAATLGIKDYPCPAGGCLLTDPSFSRRLRDLLTYSVLDIKNAELLKIGRHFRLSPECKLIVGRDETENKRLLAMKASDDVVFEPIDEMAGPVGIGKGFENDEIIRKSAMIIARYIDDACENVPVVVRKGQGQHILKTNSADIPYLDSIRI